MKLSVIIPCYNEKAFIGDVVAQVKRAPIPEKEIILVDDGSDDGSAELIKNQLESEVDRVIYHARNSGKGAAIQSGLQYVSGDLIIIQDADLEYDPQEYPKLVAPVMEGKADAVFGSRFLGGGPHRVHLFWHYVGNRILTLLSNAFTNLNLTDMEACYKLFRSDLIKDIRLEQKGFGIEPELVAKIAKKKCRIYEVGISYYGRSYREGKKITWRDAVVAVYCIVKYGIWG